MCALRSQRLQKLRAFSLVEVVIALGVVSFAFVGLLGLLPIGLTTLDTSIDATVESQIMQHIANMARQAAFSSLKADQLDIHPGPDAQFPLRQQADYFFDEQGDQITDPTLQQQNWIYSAAVFSQAGTAVPASVATSPTGYVNQDLATVRVMITRRSAPSKLRVYSILVANTGIETNNAIVQ